MKTSAVTDVMGDRKFGTVTVELPQTYEADVILVFPSGQQITLQYRLESPSIDICMPKPLPIESWCDGNLTPTVPDQKHPHLTTIQQACIDIPPDWVDEKRRRSKITSPIPLTNEVGGIIDRKQHLEYLCFMMLDALDHGGLQSVLERTARKNEEDWWREFYADTEEEGPVQGYTIPRLLKEWRDTTEELCQAVVAANRVAIDPPRKEKTRKKKT